ncbi:reverse transcriptase domain-containing protein [Tanacetum coccineum]
MQLEDVEERQQLNKGRKPLKFSVKEKIVAIMKHRLDTCPHIELKVQNKRSLAPNRRKVVTNEVNKWLKARIMRRVRYPSWVANPALDLYPLPEIDWKIESLMGFKYKCFLDAYKGSHQLQMTKKDEENTVFHTEEGVFFAYTKMPFFWLEEYESNISEAGRLCLQGADRGEPRSLCVDDMVIKSQTEQVIIRDVEQTFSTLQKINMKLNPKKCSFGVEEGNFMGYVVTSEGIRGNLEKTKAVMDMPSPRTLKQMQSLSGKLAALNHFLSKSAERSLPFLDTLKKCTNKKDFRWTEAAEATFLEMKKLVSELPTLTTLKKGKTLMMYLATTDEAVSAVLLTETDGRQIPIHYAIKEVVELKEYDIQYVPRVAVKGQILANFLADTSMEINVAPVVASTPRVYEALLARLRIATEMQVKDIHAFVDSKLVASQVEGSYKAKGERMIKYQEKFLELAGAFNRCRITHIPRAEYRKADALSKLAAVQFDHLSKEVLVEVLNERSVEVQEVNMVVEEEGRTWMTPIRNYLEKGV